MLQQLTGQMFPAFLTKETTLAELQNETKRTKIAWELANFLAAFTDYELNDEGIIEVDLTEQLLEIQSQPEPSRDFIEQLAANVAIIDTISVGGVPLTELTTDQQVATVLLDGKITNFGINLINLLEQGLFYYSESKEELDAKIAKAISFEYAVIDQFESSGNKIPEIFA